MQPSKHRPLLLIFMGLLALITQAASPLRALAEEPDAQAPPPPLYLQVRLGENHPKPSVIHVFGRRPAGPPWYVPHHNLGRAGLIAGVAEGTEEANRLNPGEASP